VFERAGARVVTDAVSLEFLRGAVVEFEDNLMRSAFKVGTGTGSPAGRAERVDRAGRGRSGGCSGRVAVAAAAACSTRANIAPTARAGAAPSSASLLPHPTQIGTNPNSESTCGCGSSFVAKS
jgi:hypothetical protein